MSAGIRVLFGTETGNAEECAHELGDALQGDGHAVSVTDMADYDPSDLPREALAVIVTSTYGNGDPPCNAEALLAWLQKEDVSVSGVSFAVCGLGDLTYPHFAQAGKDFDRLLEERGGRRILPRVDCDVIFEEPFEQFTLAVQEWLNVHGDQLSAPAAEAVEVPREPRTAPVGAPGTRANPVRATLTGRRRLNAEGSAKESMHYTFAWPGVEVDFAPGDSFALIPENNPTEVQAILEGLGLQGTQSVTIGDTEVTLFEALQRHCDLQVVPSELLERLGASQAADGSDWHLLDAVRATSGAQIEGRALVGLLRTLKPRLYSVASSPLVHPQGVHFTVETLRYTRHGRNCEGVATTWLADRVRDGESVSMYCVRAPHFRPPEDNQLPVIMIGPGTGVAPFRAFLQHRRAVGDAGKSWLFFGHQHRATDFFYEEEWADFRADGTLTKLSLAWSRDQAEKVYVQHLVQQNGEALWSWLSEGAVVYVCGDKLGMAPAVREAFVELAANFGGLTPAEAAAQLDRWEASGRYCVDAY